MVPSDRSLSDLTERVAEEFEAYRDPDGFNELSLVIDNSDREHPTLIVHIDRKQAAELADRVEAFSAIRGRASTASVTLTPISAFLQPLNSAISSFDHLGRTSYGKKPADLSRIFTLSPESLKELTTTRQ